MAVISTDPKRSLPHREPFLWVERLISRNEEGTEGVVELDVKSDDDVFQGHFPNNPIFPGVLQMEAAAQACGWVCLGVLPEGTPAPDVLFVAVDNYKFKRPVVPPSTLRFHVKQSKTRARLFLWDVEVFSGEHLVSKGSFWLQLTQKNS